MGKEKEKKEDEETHAPNPMKEKKKRWLKVAAKVLYVVLFTKMPLSYGN